MSRFFEIFSLLFLIISCQPTDQAQLESGHWDYQGANSPEHWQELSPEFLRCAEGLSQSPIDIESYATTRRLGHALQFQYHPSSIDLFNNGHTVQANLEEENTLLADGKTYSLKQIHFHEPSEHHIDGIIFPMEMHMVHADSAGKLLVVGVFIKEGPANPYLQTFWDELPAQPETHQHPDSKCKVEYLLPEHKAVYHYTGSLTTPPCTEGVEWFVMEEPIALSKKQIAHFRDLYHGNNRPVQQQTRRQVELLSD